MSLEPKTYDRIFRYGLLCAMRHESNGQGGNFYQFVVLFRKCWSFPLTEYL